MPVGGAVAARGADEALNGPAGAVLDELRDGEGGEHDGQAGVPAGDVLPGVLAPPLIDLAGDVGDLHVEDERSPATSMAFWFASEIIPASATPGSRRAAMNFSILLRPGPPVSLKFFRSRASVNELLMLARFTDAGGRKP